MKRIFEDILDDIDIEDNSESSVITKLDDSNVTDVSRYDYVLYIRFNILPLLYYTKQENLKMVKMGALKEFINPLKQKLDVYVDEYWTDDILYCNGENVNSWSNKNIDEFHMLDNVYYKVYLTLDGNLNHLISFIYSVRNLNSDASYALKNMFSCKMYENDNQEKKDLFEHIYSEMLYLPVIKDFLKHKTDDYFNRSYSSIPEEYIKMVIGIYVNFYQNKRLLKLPLEQSEWNNELYIWQRIKNFIRRFRK